MTNDPLTSDDYIQSKDAEVLASELEHLFRDRDDSRSLFSDYKELGQSVERIENEFKQETAELVDVITDIKEGNVSSSDLNELDDLSDKISSTEEDLQTLMKLVENLMEKHERAKVWVEGLKNKM